MVSKKAVEFIVVINVAVVVIKVAIIFIVAVVIFANVVVDVVLMCNKHQQQGFVWNGEMHGGA